jgi:protein disulfide-isomerase
MKRMILSAVLAGALAPGMYVHAAEGWLRDFEAARKIASEKGLPILADFSGSDWCGWCIKLDREVFSEEEFKTFAGERLVLFLADFPSKKQQPEEEAQQNKALAEKYGIRGFPTVLILDGNGEVLGRTGYRPGGADAYVGHLKQLLGELEQHEETRSDLM